jgi:hypothetical protein
VVKWIKKYGRAEILPKRIKVETMNEIDELKEARKRIRELEASLADAHMDYCLERAFLEIACDRLGTTTEDLKKKNVTTLAEKRRKRSFRKHGGLHEMPHDGRATLRGMSRQNYYKTRMIRLQHEVDSGLIEQLVRAERAERAIQPRLGGKKLFHILAPQLAKAGVTIGRDRFFDVLREKSLLLDRLPGAPKTTNSRHSLPSQSGQKYDADCSQSGSDITYIRTRVSVSEFDHGFMVDSGLPRGDTLETEGVLEALAMALSTLPRDAFPVHHSDRGSQYCLC